VRWQTVFRTVPTAVNMVQQAAMSDAEYQIIDATTAVQVKFLQIRFASSRPAAPD